MSEKEVIEKEILILDSISEIRDRTSLERIKIFCDDLRDTLTATSRILEDYDMKLVRKIPEEEPVEPDIIGYELWFANFNVGKKIPVIKAVREITGIGLREAKEVVESTGCTVRIYNSHAPLVTRKEKAKADLLWLERAGGVGRIRNIYI